MNPEARVLELRARLEDANDRYYRDDAATITDAEYDRLLRELIDLERKHPALRSPDSPTLRVGAAPSEKFAPYHHPSPMLSLGNAFDADELRAFDERARKLAGAEIAYVCELKIDGLAIAIDYRNGAFERGGTRGDGRTGEDVSANLRTIRSVPLALTKGSPQFLEVRGEVYLRKSDFERLNAARLRDGLPVFANPRNAAAGGIRQLDPKMTAGRRLSFFAYAIGAIEGAGLPATQFELLDHLRYSGFDVNPNVARAATIDDAIAYCARWEAQRDELDYEIDGVVIKVDDLAEQERLGAASREPRWAISYKFKAREARTKLTDIVINVGRTGTLNPSAVLEPVQIGGVTVSSATLHNAAYIASNDIRIGDTVMVVRAGDVIPRVVGPVLEERTGEERVFAMPDRCPVCGSAADHPEDEAMARCTNAACPAQIFERVRHFASRGAMDIEGLGDVLAEQLTDLGLVRDLADIYALDAAALATVPRTGEKSIAKLLEAIGGSKTRGLARLLTGLGIRFVGAQTAQILADDFGSIDALAEASTEVLQASDGIGPEVAGAVTLFFEQPANRGVIERLRVAGVVMTAPKRERVVGALTGKTLVLTGTLPGMTRDEAAALIAGAGGKVASAVSSKTDYVVAGADAGSKLVRAEKLEVPILDQDGLQALLRKS